MELTDEMLISHLKSLPVKGNKLALEIGISSSTLNGFLSGTVKTQEKTKEKIRLFVEKQTNELKGITKVSDDSNVILELIPSVNDKKLEDGLIVSKQFTVEDISTKDIKGKNTIPEKKVDIIKIDTDIDDEIEKMRKQFGSFKINGSQQKKTKKSEKVDTYELLLKNVYDLNNFISHLHTLVLETKINIDDIDPIAKLYDESSPQYKIMSTLFKEYNNDYTGYIYYYYIDGGDMKEIKIGRTSTIDRIKKQARSNKQVYKYNVYKTNECKRVERLVHLLLDEKKIKKDSGDGKTEWFNATEDMVTKAMWVATDILSSLIK
jgi:hypothetical protein